MKISAPEYYAVSNYSYQKINVINFYFGSIWIYRPRILSMSNLLLLFRILMKYRIKKCAREKNDIMMRCICIHRLEQNGVKRRLESSEWDTYVVDYFYSKTKSRGHYIRWIITISGVNLQNYMTRLGRRASRAYSLLHARIIRTKNADDVCTLKLTDSIHGQKIKSSPSLS